MATEAIIGVRAPSQVAREAQHSPATRSRGALADYWALTKPEINFLIAIATFAGFYVGRPAGSHELPLPLMIHTLLGTLLVASGTGTLNQYVECHFDAQMRRTARRPEKYWSDKAARISFWSLNLGLAWMVFATLFPLGILQLYHSISVSYYDARTLNYIGSRANSVLEWLRMPGDIVFILGGTLPILYLSFLGVRYMRSSTLTEEPKDVLFTDIVVQNQER